MSQFKQQSVLTSHKNKKTSNPPLIILKVTVVYNEPSVSCPLDRKRENSKADGAFTVVGMSRIPYRV